MFVSNGYGTFQTYSVEIFNETTKLKKMLHVKKEEELFATTADKVFSTL